MESWYPVTVSCKKNKQTKNNVELNQSCETNQIKMGLTKSCESETEQWHSKNK